MVLRLQVFDLLNQLLLRVLNMDLVNALRGLCPRCTPLTWLLPITLLIVSPQSHKWHCAPKDPPGVGGKLRFWRRGEGWGRFVFTFARAFLQLTHAFRVTDSGTRLRLDEEAALSNSFSLRGRRGSDPVLSDVVECLGVLAEPLLSPKEG